MSDDEDDEDDEADAGVGVAVDFPHDATVRSAPMESTPANDRSEVGVTKDTADAFAARVGVAADFERGKRSFIA